MLVLTVAMQLAVVQLQPVTTRRIYDVDLQVMRGADTLAMPLIRLADGLEGRLMISPAGVPTLLLRTTVQREQKTGCNVIQLQIGELTPGESERDFIPALRGRLCQGEEVILLQAVGTESERPAVMVRVHPLPVATSLPGSN